MSYVRARLGYSQRRICRALGISRNTVRYEPQSRPDETALTGSIIKLAEPVRPLRLSTCACAVAGTRLAGESRPGSPHLATRGP